ncbi:hypothetical protein HS088_TW07G01317 [Tripterygium wilfordii]|uniref:F-box protein n=1 Tax=Tripterygium wilfordii TaxID=458696 RepID=A0A7J7DH74_TRIWF|nr:uncharacterized protein LOC120001954 [Tripterygium wilfordii]KAF5745725.1 hypothetical protein HS088_TW07G01317 [Tripterygium wilfordii]
MSNHKSGEMTGQPLHPNQSVWMAHWTSTNTKSASPAHQRLLHYEPKGDDHKTMSCPLLTGPVASTDCSKHGLDFKEFGKVKTNYHMNDSLTTGSKKSRNEIFNPFPMFNVSKDSMFDAKSDQTPLRHQIRFRLNNSPDSGFISSPGRTENKLSSLPACAPPEIGTSSRECLFQSEGITKYLEQQFIPVKTLGKDSSAASSSSHDDFTRSATKIVPYGMNRSETSVKSLLHREEEINQSSSVIASKERFKNNDYNGHSSLFVKEKPIHNEATLLVRDLSPSNSEAADFLGEQRQNTKNNYGLGLFPSRSNSLEKTESENLYQWYSVPKLPCSVRDEETMRICTAEDSTEESSRGPPFFSQTTHHFLITKKTDINVSDGSQMFKESMVSSKCKGKVVGELLSLSPDLSFQVPRGVKLQALDGCTQIERKGITGSVETSAVQIRNESSAETDTMDMNPLRENDVSGMASSSSNKGVLQKSPKAQAATASGREEIGDGVLNMNQQPPALAGVVSLSNDRETSTSRTQSLNVDQLFSHAEQHTNSKFCAYHGELGPEPSSRWVKRLKSSASGSFDYGTKSLKMEEASSQRKVHNLFGKMSKRSITDSADLQMGKRHGKHPMLLDQTILPLGNSGSSSNDLLGKSDITLSHPWIQRWCRHQATSPKTTAEAPVMCEPQRSKATAFEYQKKKFPSIAAMALMAKTMTGFQPCEFINKGPVVVWNS